MLIDELKGRDIAEKNGLKIIGILGVLIKAYREKLIDHVKPIVDSLMTDAGFRIHPELYKELIRLAGEYTSI